MPLDATQNERVICATLMGHDDGWHLVAGLAATDFADPFCRRTFEAIGELINAGKPCDIVAVCNRGLDIATLGQMVAGYGRASTNLHYHAQAVKDAAALRRLDAACRETILGLEAKRPAGEILNEAATTVSDISNHIRADAIARIGDTLGEWLDNFDDQYNSGRSITGLPTGFRDFDDLTTGMHGGDLLIIAGRPGMGKTTLAINIAERVAGNGTPVMIFSLEMSLDQLRQRVLASHALVPLDHLRAPARANEEDCAALLPAVARVKALPLFIDDTPGLSLPEFRSRASKAKRLHGIGLIVVDYLQLMSAKAESRVNEISALSRGLKLVAKELGIPVIALSQLNRSVDARTSKRPILSDLRDSGSIEQDADLVSFVFREEKYDAESPNKGTAEWIIEKQRMGPTGTIRLAFQGQFSRFDSFAGNWVEKDEAFLPFRGGR